MSMTHAKTFTTVHDPQSGQLYYKCDTCGEAHHFRSGYMARQWANRHGEMHVKPYCTCH